MIVYLLLFIAFLITLAITFNLIKKLTA